MSTMSGHMGPWLRVRLRESLGLGKVRVRVRLALRNGHRTGLEGRFLRSFYGVRLARDT